MPKFFIRSRNFGRVCRYNSMVECELPKLNMRVRFPLPAPITKIPLKLAGFFIKNKASLIRRNLIYGLLRRFCISLLTKKKTSSLLNRHEIFECMKIQLCFNDQSPALKPFENGLQKLSLLLSKLPWPYSALKLSQTFLIQRSADFRFNPDILPHLI